MCRDEKLVRVALKAKQPIERVLWVWAAILESASEVNDNGRYDFDIGEASYFLRCDESDVGGICDALESLGRICEGMVSKWGDRQFSSDTSAERQKRYRDRKKTSDGDNGDGYITSQLRDGDAPETDLETDLESEQKDMAAEAASISIRIERDRKRLVEERAKLHLLGCDWNSLAKDLGLAQIEEIVAGSAREISALTRIREDRDFPRAFTKIRGSPFLRGDKGSTPCTFDWIIKPANFQKIVEGNYDEIRKAPVQQRVYAGNHR